jgi:hypothetical protein
MAVYWALSSGNWSNLSNWLTGTTPGSPAGALPSLFDDVYANGRTIIVDITTQVNTVRNTSSSNNIAGGRFVLNSGVTLSALVFGGGVGGTSCVQFLSGGSNFATIVGNLCAINLAVTDPRVVSNDGSGTLNIFCNQTYYECGVGGLESGYIYNAGTLNLFGNFSGPNVNRGNHGILNINTVNLVGNLSGLIDFAQARGLVSRATTSTTVNITGNLYGRNTGAFAPYAVNNDSPGQVNLFGDIFGAGIFNSSRGEVKIFGNIRERGSGISSMGILNSSSGIVSIVGNISGVNSSAALIENSSTGSIFITGNVFGGSLGSNIGINNTSRGSITVNGVVTGGTGSNSHGLRNVNGVVSINGLVRGGTGSGALGAVNDGLGSIFVKTAIGNNWGIGSGIETPTPAAGNSGISNINLFGACYVEEISAGSRGQFPTVGQNIYINRKPNNQATFLGATSAVVTAQASSSYIVSPTAVVVYSSLSGGGTIAPLASNVRLNVIYDFNSRTGTCLIPDRRTVLNGVLVDNTTGTFFSQLDQAWNTRVITVSTPNTFGARLKNIITLSAAGNTWALNE